MIRGIRRIPFEKIKLLLMHKVKKGLLEYEYILVELMRTKSFPIEYKQRIYETLRKVDKTIKELES